MEWWDFAGTFHKNHKSGTNVYTNEVGASPAKNGIMWNGCLWQTLGIFGVSKVYTLTIPKVHASLDLSWSGGGVPNENDAGPQSLQNNTLTIHYTAHLFRHCAQACYNYSGQNEITVTCWHRNHCHLLASGELNLRYSLMLAWHRIEHQPNHEKVQDVVSWLYSVPIFYVDRCKRQLLAAT